MEIDNTNSVWTQRKIENWERCYEKNMDFSSEFLEFFLKNEKKKKKK